MLAGISFLNVVVGNQFLLTLLVASSHSAAITAQWRNAVLQFSVHSKMLVWFGWDILQVVYVKIEISSCQLARALFRVFIRIFTTVVINCKLGYIDIPL